jgi:hypothetical protein
MVPRNPERKYKEIKRKTTRSVGQFQKIQFSQQG